MLSSKTTLFAFLYFSHSPTNSFNLSAFWAARLLCSPGSLERSKSSQALSPQGLFTQISFQSPLRTKTRPNNSIPREKPDGCASPTSPFRKGQREVPCIEATLRPLYSPLGGVTPAICRNVG